MSAQWKIMKASDNQDGPSDDISILENKIQRLTDLIRKEPSVSEHYDHNCVAKIKYVDLERKTHFC